VELLEARQWVWSRLARRAGQATKNELYRAWDHAPGLLDDALRSLREDGWLACTSGRWHMRDPGPGARPPGGRPPFFLAPGPKTG